MLSMSTRPSTRDDHINTTEMVSSIGPWIPQTPDSQQGSAPKEQWQDDEEE